MSTAVETRKRTARAFARPSTRSQTPVRVIVHGGPESGAGVQDSACTIYTQGLSPCQARGVYEHNSLKYSSAGKKLPSRR